MRHFNGRRYYWDGRYWARHTGCRIPVRLHADVWTHHFGPMPNGYEIHHFDENRDNNDISNLLIVTPQQHDLFHRERAQQHMRNIQPLGQVAAAQWHGSEQGLEWHKQHFANVMAKIGDLTCDECGVAFTPANFRQRFCTKRCGNRFKMRNWRRRQGIPERKPK